MCVRDYSKEGGIVQVGWSSGNTRKGKKGIRGQGKREENEKRAAARACANLRRDLLEIGADRLLTLTYRENMQNREKGKLDLQEFERRVRRHYPGWKTAGVAERQERGAIHFHLGISGFHDVKVLRRCWRKTVGEGNVDIAFRPNGKGNCYIKLAAYITKYLRKDMEKERVFGEHRYHRSRDIERRCTRYVVSYDRPVGLVGARMAFDLLPGAAIWTSISEAHFGYLEVIIRERQPQPSKGGDSS